MFPENDFVLVTGEELVAIDKKAASYGFAIGHYYQTRDGRYQIPCAVWCAWVREGWTNG